MGRSKQDQEHRTAKRPKAAKAKRSKTEHAEVSTDGGADAAKESIKLGAKQALRRALKDKLNAKSANDIAAALVKKTIEGDKNCSEMLMTLVMNKKDEDGKAKKKKKRSGPSLADLLASEPEWVDPQPESTAEVEMGGREPENTDF